MDETLMTRRTALSVAALATTALGARTVLGADLNEAEPNTASNGDNLVSTPGALGDTPDNKTSAAADHRPSGKTSGVLVRPAKGQGPQVPLGPGRNP